VVVGVGSLYYLYTYKVTMPHPTKKQKLEGQVASADGDFVASFDDVVDVLPNILGFLPPKDIIRARVCKNCREAARKTIVPPTVSLYVNCDKEYNAMRVMTTELPNLQFIDIHGLGRGNKYSDGEDPNERLAAETANSTTHDIGIISNFRKLRELTINMVGLNGKYPVLFNSFPLLQKLTIKHCNYLKWDLEMLAGLPLLKELDCYYNHRLTGNISSLRLIDDTLERVTIEGCENVEGNFMDLADLPRLKKLDLERTDVKGDIRDIGANDFSSLECLTLPKTVYGGRGYEFQRISDAPDLVRTVYLLKKQRPALELKGWYATLSVGSPDRYESADGEGDTPPFDITLIEAGSRLGYRWETRHDCDPCEVNWLDPEPDRESRDYEKYIEGLQKIDRWLSFYKGFHQPPTEEEYNILVEELAPTGFLSE
jgi:hypothetical protein